MPSPRRFAAVALAIMALGGCRRKPDATVALPADPAPVVDRRDEPPVALDAESPAEYPAALFQQRLSGTVMLRLFADASGRVAPESTRVQESSGYPALDSAALAAVPRMHFAPALRNGIPVATLFLQPIHFRHPDRGGTTP